MTSVGPFIKECVVMEVFLENEWHPFKVYNNNKSKTWKTARKHLKMRRAEYGLRFRLITGWTGAEPEMLNPPVKLEDMLHNIEEQIQEKTNAEERTSDTIQRQETNDGPKRGESAGDEGAIDPDDRDGGGRLLCGIDRGRAGGDTTAIFQRLNRPKFTEENYKAGLIAVTGETLKGFEETLGFPPRTDEEYERRAESIIAGDIHPFPTNDGDGDFGSGGQDV